MNNRFIKIWNHDWLAAVGLSLALSLQIASSAIAQADGTLTFSSDGEVVQTIELSALKQAVKSHSIEVENPYYVEDKSVLKRYNAFAVKDVLDLVYGVSWKNGQDNAIAIIAADGYKTETNWQVLSQKGGYLAFEDLDVNQGWQTLLSHGKEVDPGPFFLLWTESAQTYDAGFPWSWQVAEVELKSSD